MTFNQMRYFIEVANCSSFSRAAQNLYISQSSLTKYIANLEKELDMRLFDRSTHHVRLTDEGRMLLQKTELTFSELSRSIEEVQLMSRNQFHVMTTTIGVSMDEIIPSDILNFLYERNTGDDNIRYTLEESSFSGLIHHLLGHSYDMVISTDRNIRQIAGLSYVVLRHSPLFLAVNKRHPLADKPDLKPTDFGDTPVFFSLPDGKDSSQFVLESVFSRTGGVINIQVMSTPAELLMNVQIGAGIAIVSGLVDQSKYPDVIFRTFESDRGMYQSLVWRTADVTPAMQELIDYVVVRYAAQIQLS